MDIAEYVEDTRAPGGGSALAGFLVSGFLLALLGAILPAWGYHRDPPEFLTIGNYFLAMGAGIIVANQLARPLQRRRGLPFLLVFSGVLGCATLLFLALVAPPVSEWWRSVSNDQSLPGPGCS